jgi:hypothetical protein
MSGAAGRWFNRRGWRDVIIASPYLWLVAFFLVPFIIVIVMSFAKTATQSPPFAFLPDWPFIRFRNLPPPFHQQPLHPRRRHLGLQRRRRDGAVPADRLSHGAGHHARRQIFAAPLAHAGDPALLDLLLCCASMPGSDSWARTAGSTRR